MKPQHGSFVRAMTIYPLTLIFAILCISLCTKAQPHLYFKQAAKSLLKPLEIKNAGDGSGRIFIAEQAGLIKIYKNGAIINKPFLDLSQTVGIGQYFGIWSIAFSPAYSENGYFFIFYTAKTGTTILARCQVSKSNPDSANLNSIVTLLKFDKTLGLGHYGNLQFGNDGYLYLSTGAGTRNTNAQDGNSLFGKILRLNVNVSAPPYYEVPSDNPFINDPGVRDEVWQLGLRNAWRWSFDKINGDMWIADVGQDSMEEINYRKPAQSAGSNFGWPCYEGTNVFSNYNCGSFNQYVSPIFEYHHDVSNGGECVTGGYVYKGNSYPGMFGYYICIDFISGNAWKIKSNGAGGWNVDMQSGLPKGIASFGESEDKELFAVGWTTGTLYQVMASGTAATTELYTLQADTTKNIGIKSRIYPTLVENGSLILELKEKYAFASVIDISGREVMRKILDREQGTIMMNVAELPPGHYLIQLVGAQIFQQKIYKAK
ncbi:MAG TPA: PQQ-dependent sugar dehydrogenase [Panacibacter sp.]|nr:PQQ-dependent sugar dehydrogenase [Panacibacter sp.]HNP46079.1 PQQ-dependent sugar dehydrogenase [Panacibacter sp.]